VSVDLIALLTADDLERLADRLSPLLIQPSNGDGWLRGSERIGAYIGLDGASVRRRLRTDAELRKIIAREGRDLVAEKSALDAYMRRNGQ
jgi:hypothetical protein